MPSSAAAILPGEIAQVVAVAGDDRPRSSVSPLLHAQLREIGLAEAVEVLAAHRAAVRHRGPLVRGRIDHAAPPMADVLAARWSRAGGSSCRVRGRRCDRRASNQPKPRASRRQTAQRPGVHGSNLVADDLGEAAARPDRDRGRVAAARRAARAPRRQCAAPAAGLRAAPPGDRLLPGVAGVLEADPLAVADEPAVVVDAQRRRLAGLLVPADR